MITLDALRRICPHTPASTLDRFVAPLNEAFEEFDISTQARQAAFLAQAAHESGGFRYMRELASGEAYEGRMSLGNDEPGEGVRFKGRGIFQLTGNFNYRDAGIALFLDADWFRANPALAELPENACRIAGWFWKSRGLNELADRGDFRGITRRINGGYNGLEYRLAYHAIATEVLAGT